MKVRSQRIDGGVAIILKSNDFVNGNKKTYQKLHRQMFAFKGRLLVGSL